MILTTILSVRCLSLIGRWGRSGSENWNSMLQMIWSCCEIEPPSGRFQCPCFPFVPRSLLEFSRNKSQILKLHNLHACDQCWSFLSTLCSLPGPAEVAWDGFILCVIYLVPCDLLRGTPWKEQGVLLHVSSDTSLYRWSWAACPLCKTPEHLHHSWEHQKKESRPFSTLPAPPESPSLPEG